MKIKITLSEEQVGRFIELAVGKMFQNYLAFDHIDTNSDGSMTFESCGDDDDTDLLFDTERIEKLEEEVPCSLIKRG